MLQNLREHAQGWIASVIAIVLCLAFALFGIQYYIGGSHSTNAVAKVNGQEITSQQVAAVYKLLRQRLAGPESPDTLDDVTQKKLQATALQEVVTQQVLFDAATHDGFKLSNDQIGGIIASVPFFQLNGQFSQAMFERFAEEYYGSQEAFLNDVKQKGVVLQQRSGITDTAFTLPNEIDHSIQLAAQKRDIAYLIIPAARFLPTAKITDADIQNFYQSHKSQFMTKEQVSINYLELSGDQLTKKIAVSDAELQQYYQDNQTAFTTPEQWQLARILIKLPDTADAAALKSTADKVTNLSQQLKSGQDFAKLALQFSDDKTTAISGGVMGWISRTQLSPAIQQAVARLSPGQLTGPIRTPDGLVLIKLLGVKKGTVIPFALVRDKVASNLRQQKAEQQLANASDQLANLTYTNPDTLKVAADTLGLPIQTTGLFTRQGDTSGLAANPKIVTIAFSDNVLQQNNNSDVISLDNQTLVVIRIAEHKPSVLQPLAEVKPSIEKQLQLVSAQQAAKNLGDSLVAALQKGATPNELASQNQLTATQKTAVTRQTSDVPAEVLKLAFSLSPHVAVNGKGAAPTVGGKALTNGDYAVVTVINIQPGNPQSAQPAVRQQIAAMLAAQLGRFDYYLYVNHQLSTAKIKYEATP